MKNFFLVIACVLLLIRTLAQQPVKVACLGASITAGARLPHPETQAYPQQLQKLLGGGYHVTNYGVSSATLLRKGDLSYWSTSAYQSALRSQPDIVTIDLGGNDSKLINRIYADELLKDGADLIRSFSCGGRHPRIIILLPLPCFLADTTQIYDRVIVREIIPRLQQLAASFHAEVLDLHTPFVDKESWFGDKIHPDERGAALTAEKLAELIRRGPRAHLAVGPPLSQTLFTPDFAPGERATTPAERTFRDDTCLNGYWRFMPVTLDPHPDRPVLEQAEPPAHFAGDPTPIRIPSPWNVNSFPNSRDGGDFITYPSYPARWDTVRAGWLRRRIPYKPGWAGHRLVLHFEAVAGYCRVFVNGVLIGSHFDNFLPFDLDITPAVRPGKNNELLVWVASSRLFDRPGPYGRRPYVGGSFWGQHIAGIWQDVDLLVRPATYISQTVVQTLVSQDSLRLQVAVRNTQAHAVPVQLSAVVRPWINEAGTSVIEAPEPRWRLGKVVLESGGPSVVVPAHTDTTINFSVAVHGRLARWEPGQPNLYGLLVKTGNDIAYTRFGWRETTIRDKQFFLNGEPIILKGDSWHFMGIPQLTRRYAWAWYTMLKAAHVNAVRLHAQPYPSFYLDMADEMGILVLDETAMWASDGGPDITSDDYWTRAADHLRNLIIRDRNHPSVFGFSVCNENIPVAVNVFHAPEALVQRQLAEIDRWVKIVQVMDPTRPWISGDGETGRPTELPTLIGHYGGEGRYKEWSSGPLLWGVGESGMAYYGTPRQTAVYNGEASYVSAAGRMQGVADEALKLANAQKRYHAVYRSIFNLVWYGLKPLELGLADTTRAPMPCDGIFFHTFKEGQPGVQPERLGPYTTTLNPGYDPNLPLYRPWPLFTTLAAAYADTGVQADPPKPQAAEQTAPAADAVRERVGARDGAHSVRVLSGDTASLDTLLRRVGVGITAPGNATPGAGIDLAAGAEHILIDGIHLPDAGALADALSAARDGASVLIWGIRPSTTPAINAVLPEKITLTARKATSYIPADRTLGENDDWYFSELSKQPVSEYAFSGDAVSRGQVLLAACRADWQRWNGRPEYAKTAALLRSEREARPAGNVLVSYPVRKGRVELFSIDPETLYKVSRPALRHVLEAWGVRPVDSAANANAALNAEGRLVRAMINGAVSSVADGLADVPAPVQLGFWLYSPRSLVNLLVEPDIPTVSLAVRGSTDWQLRVNDSPAKPGALPLQKGWNHILIDIRKRTGEALSIQLSSDHRPFLSTLRSSAIAADTDATN
ncbi:MAG TPA: GDSL-type esterase/lipase family protein [Puia sp.]|nr:GDSL-type esterase/lipase family protein [Puia sp.]